MKIKKVNVGLAAVVVGGVLLLPSVLGLVANNVWRPLASAGSAAVEAVASDRGDLAVFSSEGRPSTAIAWRSHQGEMPGQATLKKWVVGDRTYYKVAGPIHPRFRDRAARPTADWGTYFACEVFFARGGTTYDQWIINPNGSFVLHFPHPWAGDYRKAPHSDLPASRCRTEVQGNRISVTFWCHNNDAPQNIVFNYNNPTESDPNRLSWVATDTPQGDQVANLHHAPDTWSGL